MRPITGTETASEIDDEAAKWAARRELGAWSNTDQMAFDAWCAGDARHLGAFARACAISRALDLAAPEIDMEPAKISIGWARIGAALAASIVLFFVGWTLFAPKSLPVREIMAGHGDLHATGLEDGTSVTLNTDSEIQVRFDQQTRSVEILRGEALFDVRKDPDRPFIVRAGSLRLRAVGTSFALRRYKDDGLALWVREGVVALEQEPANARGTSAVSTFETGHFVRVDASGQMTDMVLKSDQMDRALSWRNGLINLEGMTLAEAVAEYARYSNRKIVLKDQALGALRLSGLFSSRDPEAFCKAAAMAFGLNLVIEKSEIRISPKSAKNI